MVVASCMNADSNAVDSEDSMATTIAAAVPATLTTESSLDKAVADAISATQTASEGDQFLESGSGQSAVGGSEVPGTEVIRPEHGEYQLVDVWGNFGDGVGEFDEPHALAVAPDGHLFVAERLGFRMQEFDAKGAVRNEWTSDFLSDPPSIVLIEDIDAMPDGTIVGFDSQHFDFFDRDGMYRIETDLPFYCEIEGEDFPIFDSSDGMAVDQVGNIYVADSCESRVIKFTRAGKKILDWKIDTADWSRNSPCDVAVGTDGTVFVADCASGRIIKYSPDGAFISLLDDAESGWGMFDTTSFRIATGANAEVVVADAIGDRVVMLDVNGSIIESWSVVVPGFNVNIQDVDISDDGTIYVAVTNGASYNDEYGQRQERPDSERGDFVLVYDRADEPTAIRGPMATVGPEPTPTVAIPPVPDRSERISSVLLQNFYTGEIEGGRARIENDVFVVEYDDFGLTRFSASDEPIDDAHVSVELRIDSQVASSDNARACLFVRRWKPTKAEVESGDYDYFDGSWYEFCVQGNGVAQATHWGHGLDSYSTEVLAETDAGYVDAASWTKISIVARKDRTWFLANDSLVGYAQYDAVLSGSIGVVVRNYDQAPGTFMFRNLEAYHLS